MGGEQPPGNGLAVWGGRLGNRFKLKVVTVRLAAPGALASRGSGERDEPNRSSKRGLTLGPTRTLAQGHRRVPSQRPWRAIVAQGAATDQASIVVNSTEHMDTRFPAPAPTRGTDRPCGSVPSVTVAALQALSPQWRFYKRRDS